MNIALCLSGGGFRATFFHLGLIRFLRRFDLLRNVTHISSASGGSVLAAHLALNWNLYTGSDDEYASVEAELIAFGARDIRGRVVRRWLLSIIFPVLRVSSRYSKRTHLLEQEYNKLFKGALLRDLLTENGRGRRPNVHLLTTSFTTGRLCSFSAEGFWSHSDDGSKLHPTGMISLGFAVASSSAFPPLFPPAAVKRKTLNASTADLPYDPEYLTDAGIFDNLGYEGFSRIVNSECLDDIHCIISDASATLDWDTRSRFNWVSSRTIRTTDVLMKRVADHTLSKIRQKIVSGTASHLRISQLIPSCRYTKPLSIDLQTRLASVRTDLDKFTSFEVQCLMRHGDEVALSQLIRLVKDNTDFGVLACGSGVLGSDLDLPSSSIAGAVRKLDLAKARRIKLFEGSDWISYFLMTYVIVLAISAVLPYFYFAKQAAEGKIFTSSLHLSFATDRLPDSALLPTGTDGDQMHVGTAVVSVPADLDSESFEDPLEGDRIRSFAVESVSLNTEHSYKQVNSSSSSLMFIGGFNLGFNDSLIETAAIASYLRYKGDMIDYSWPSDRALTVAGYAASLFAARKSGDHLAEYIEVLQGNRSKPLHIITSGMGAVVMLGALSKMSNNPTAHTETKPFGQIIFVAPDVASDEFIGKLGLVRDLAEHVFVILRRNVTLLASQMLIGQARVGEDDAATLASIAGVDVVMLDEGNGPVSFGAGLKGSLGIIDAVLNRRSLSGVSQTHLRSDKVWEVRR